jgi:predicted DNA-binding protein with PD1-like motif
MWETLEQEGRDVTMKQAELEIGRTFAVVFEHGEEFYPTLQKFCAENNVKQGYIQSFIAGFSSVELVGTCQRLDDPQAPVWSSVHLKNVEVLGSGTLASNEADGTVAPHIHVTVGLKELSALGHTSHLLNATVQFLVEMTIVEVLSPRMVRTPRTDLYNVPLLDFTS